MKTKNIIAFVNHVEILSQKTFEKTENVNYILSQVWELFKYNEWKVRFENLLDNLYEINFKIDDKAIALGKLIINE